MLNKHQHISCESGVLLIQTFQQIAASAWFNEQISLFFSFSLIKNHNFITLLYLKLHVRCVITNLMRNVLS